jgi:hypothetical protein
MPYGAKEQKMQLIGSNGAEDLRMKIGNGRLKQN